MIPAVTTATAEDAVDRDFMLSKRALWAMPTAVLLRNGGVFHLTGTREFICMNSFYGNIILESELAHRSGSCCANSFGFFE